MVAGMTHNRDSTVSCWCLLTAGLEGSQAGGWQAMSWIEQSPITDPIHISHVESLFPFNVR